MAVLDSVFTQRFTPTCVGTTSTLCPFTCPWSVHPHVRGDDLRLRDVVLYRRFTPTCVGTTNGGSSAPVSLSVHPHVRGDNSLSRIFIWFTVGSPPRAWGQPAEVEVAARAERFTPTCVGTTMSCS